MTKSLNLIFAILATPLVFGLPCGSLYGQDDGKIAKPTVLDLEFVAKAMAMSPDEKQLLIWGDPVAKKGQSSPRGGPNEIAVIDISKMKVVIRKTLPQGVRCATIDDKFVYVAPNSDNLFYRFDHSLRFLETV